MVPEVYASQCVYQSILFLGYLIPDLVQYEQTLKATGVPMGSSISWTFRDCTLQKVFNRHNPYFRSIRWQIVHCFTRCSVQVSLCSFLNQSLYSPLLPQIHALKFLLELVSSYHKPLCSDAFSLWLKGDPLVRLFS